MPRQPSDTNMPARHGFVDNVLTLAGGNAIAQAITIALVPVITRLYTPDAFGQFATLMAVSTVFIGISSLRYNAAILLPTDLEESINVAALAQMLVCLIAGLLFFLTLVMQEEMNQLLKFDSHSKLLLVAPAIVLLGGTFNVMNAVALRARKFRPLALSRIAGAASDRAVSIAAGLVPGIGPFGLVLGKASGQATMLLLIVRSAHLLQRKDADTIGWAEIKFLAVKYKRFALYSWMALVQQLNVNLPMLFLGVFFPASVVGFFALGRRTLLEPGHVVGNAIAKTFFERSARDFRAGRNLSHQTLRLFRALLKYTVIPMALFSFSAAELFAIVFGEPWRIAGEYARVMAPLFVSTLLIRPLSIFFDLFDKQHEQAIYNLVVLLVSGSILTAGGILSDAYTTVLMYSLANVVLVTIRISMLAALSGIRPETTLREILRSMLHAGLFVLPVIVIKHVFAMPERTTLVVSMVLMALYAIYLLLTDEVLSRLIKRKSDTRH